MRRKSHICCIVGVLLSRYLQQRIGLWHDLWRIQIPFGSLCPLLHVQEASPSSLSISLGQTTDYQWAFSICCSVQGWDGTALSHLQATSLSPPRLSRVSWVFSQHTFSLLSWWRALFCGYRRDCKQGRESKEAVTSLWGGHEEAQECGA